MKRINNTNLLGLKADFANKKVDHVEDIINQLNCVNTCGKFDDAINMDDRNIKGPFGDPPLIDSIKMRSIISEEDYRSMLKFADPRGDFLTDMIDESVKNFELCGSRIIQGRYVPM